MANGNTNPYDLQNIGFQQIMGAGQGGQDLQSLIQGLFGTLREGGYFGAGEKGDMSSLGIDQWGPRRNLGGTGYNLQNLMGGLESKYGEGGTGSVT